MNKMVRYEALVPLIVSVMVDGKPQVLALPEGGVLGFDGKYIYSPRGKTEWERALTQKHYLIKWIEKGTVKRLKDDTTPKTTKPLTVTETLMQAHQALEQATSAETKGILEGAVGVPQEPPVLPMVY